MEKQNKHKPTTITQHSVIKTIKRLNNPKIGSLGEYIYCEIMKQDAIKVKSFHKNQVDFILSDGTKVDVKTQRKLNEYSKKHPKYYGKKIKGVTYCLIVFYKNKLVYSQGKHMKSFEYDKVNAWINNWGSNKKKAIPIQTDKVRKQKVNEIKNFIKKSLKPTQVRIIYRTNQADFGDESPGNLIPSKKVMGRLNIFLNFEYDISVENLIEIIAFKDEESTYLPLLSKNRLYEEKVDLKKIDKKYRYASIEELISREHY